MSSADGIQGDAAILNDIRELASGLSNARTRTIIHTTIDAVALNPQPIPPGIQAIFQSVIDAVALNPQPLPPGPGEAVSLNPQPLPPGPPEIGSMQ